MWYKLLVPAGLLVSAGSVVGHGSNLIVSTTSGAVQGYSDANTTSVKLNKWLGIPFAQDTSGKNRWKAPQPFPVSRTIFNATAYGPACMQGRCVSWRQSNIHVLTSSRADGGNGTSIQSEDCLRINIISPSGATNLPVYLYS